MAFLSPRQHRFVMARLRRSNGRSPEVVRIDRDEMVSAVKEGTKDGFDALGRRVGQMEEGLRDELRADTEKLAQSIHDDNRELRSGLGKVVEAVDRVNDTLRSKLR